MNLSPAPSSGLPVETGIVMMQGVLAALEAANAADPHVMGLVLKSPAARPLADLVRVCDETIADLRKIQEIEKMLQKEVADRN